jgi:hypothetical protein
VSYEDRISDAGMPAPRVSSGGDAAASGSPSRSTLDTMRCDSSMCAQRRRRSPRRRARCALDHLIRVRSRRGHARSLLEGAEKAHGIVKPV